MTNLFANGLSGLSGSERARALGLSHREWCELANEDRRIIDHRTLSCSGPVWRLREWLGRGRPKPVFAELSFVGDRSIRKALLEFLALAPWPVADHAIRSVFFIGVGVDSRGWALSHAPQMSSPDGKRLHVVALANSSIDVIAHEVGHSWTFDVEAFAEVSAVALSQARRSVYREAAESSRMAAALVKNGLLLERRADAAASCWLRRKVVCGNRSRTTELRTIHEVAFDEN